MTVVTQSGTNRNAGTEEPTTLDPQASTPTEPSANAIASTTAETIEITSALPTIPAEIFEKFPRLKTFTIDSGNENTVFASNATSPTDSYESIGSNEPNGAFVLPLKIILPIRHAHAATSGNGSYQQYDYIILKLNDSAFHGHFDSDKPLHLFPLPNESSTPTADDIVSIDDERVASNALSGSNDGENEIQRIITRNKSNVYTDEEGFRYQKANEYKIVNETGDVVVEFDEFRYDQSDKVSVLPNREVEPEARELKSNENTYESPDVDTYDAHYSKMMQWIYFYL